MNMAFNLGQIEVGKKLGPNQSHKKKTWAKSFSSPVQGKLK
jgi:hypothetical protein